jgi:hypothetical protein
VRGSTARGVRQWGDRTPRRGRQPCGGALNERATRTGAPERPGAVSLESLQSTLVWPWVTRNFELCDKNARYKSFRWDIPLQYLQRPTYVLVTGLVGNASWKSAFARLKSLFIWLLTEFLSSNTSKFETPPIGKVVSSKRRTTFILADFEVFRRNLENAPKVLEIGMDIREFDRCLTRVWPLMSVDSIKGMISTNYW